MVFENMVCKTWCVITWCVKTWCVSKTWSEIVVVKKIDFLLCSDNLSGAFNSMCDLLNNVFSAWTSEFFESDMKIKKWNLGIIFELWNNELWNNDVRFNSCIRLRKSRIFLMYKLIGWRISQWFNMVWRDSIFLTCFFILSFWTVLCTTKKSQSVSNKHVG